MDFKEFLKDIKKVKNNRIHKVNNSYGSKDAFSYYRKIKPNKQEYVITDCQYLKIIRLINDSIRELLVNGNEFTLPERMGLLELRKVENHPKIVDGKLKNTRPVNWDATLKLWYEYPKYKDSKTLVREESSQIFRVHYNKNKAIYNNKTFYDFLPNRELKIKLKNNIKKNKIEAFQYGK